MDEAHRLGAIPVFRDPLPYTENVNVHCDTTVEFPSAADCPIRERQADLWAELLPTGVRDPRLSLSIFARNMVSFRQASIERGQVAFWKASV
jgi:hypothetical protein